MSDPVRAPELTPIDRREAIRRVSLLLGGTALVGGSSLWTACRTERVPASGPIGRFTSGDVQLLDEVADTMLPATSTPGAKAAHVGPFMAMMVTDCYDERDQQIFRDGLQHIDNASSSAFGKPFMSVTPEQRLALLESFDREAKSYMGAKKEGDRSHWFRMVKELAMLGYFTSEIGYTQAQRYAESPGRFDPCVPYQSGEKAWAPHA
ncbi:MAG TPA: gluconate 2-dehydrogenase subunit 3 family protein [Gemmatimonadaceae bacterium]|nr:gluconate 2-dehydrogenase subunit 3 family protein [Gemmatimonadaceae bacterium]